MSSLCAALRRRWAFFHNIGRTHKKKCLVHCFVLGLNIYFLLRSNLLCSCCVLVSVPEHKYDYLGLFHRPADVVGWFKARLRLLSFSGSTLGFCAYHSSPDTSVSSLLGPKKNSAGLSFYYVCLRSPWLSVLDALGLPVSLHARTCRRLVHCDPHISSFTGLCHYSCTQRW